MTSMSGMTETFTHAVIYDAADNHRIELVIDWIKGCTCGFECPEWDDEGDTLVDHLRSLGPRVVHHVDLDPEDDDDGGPPYTFTIAAGQIGAGDE